MVEYLLMIFSIFLFLFLYNMKEVKFFYLIFLKIHFKQQFNFDKLMFKPQKIIS